MAQQYCPVCHHDDMTDFIELKDLPIHCNLLWPSREAAQQAPKGDIRLGFCQVCGMIYNRSFDPSRMQYTQAYENSLFFSPHFQAYAQEQAAQLIERYQLRDKNVLEIGCGKGEFLSLLCQGGQNRGVGFDPSYDGRSADSGMRENITIIRDFYSEAYAEYAADFICCRQVLEHLRHPCDFLWQLRRTIGDRRDTVVFFEVPNVLYTLQDLGIWDIIYEHCSYFSAPALTRLFQATGFTVLQAYPAFDGQYLCLEAIPVAEDALSGAAVPEKLGRILGDVVAFGENYRNKVKTWNGRLSRLFAAGNRIVVWGAGSKGVTFLNAIENGERIHCVADVNPHKQGKYVAGTGQEVVSLEEIARLRPDTILVMNPIYKDEIWAKMSELGVDAESMVV
jgi:SAM-dependent methyltransferase